ncbi:membrane protein [Acrocarpospora phusangensis]|uniref:Membrane protein n=1 Tax=Acrocarpospora phusangensis TaxID=1070424 RepID=A0A919QES7_9ACTN|nr:DUF1206 domain-containing protein [Acrocarpospora phusangensis]GIH26173.1 membrane protein [Acrocarpospora phusangensis]
MVSTSPTSKIARRVAEHPVLDRVAKIGFAARGVLYGIIGLVALQIGLGNGGGAEADKSGAIHLVASRPLGGLLLWIMAIGLAGLALWQTGELVFGSHEPLDRVEAAARVVVYVLLVISLLGLLLQDKRASSTDEQSEDLTRLLFGLSAGPVLVGLLGLGLVAFGVFSVREGWTERFMRHMRVTEPRTRTTVVKLGKAGYIARGVIAAAAGGLICQAALTYDPEKAVGIDGALRALAATPAGPWLLVVVAGGLVLFAVYCFAEARWHRT